MQIFTETERWVTYETRKIFKKGILIILKVIKILLQFCNLEYTIQLK